MSKRKSAQYEPKLWETSKPKSDGFERFFHTMIISDAWKDLTPNAVKLYVAMRDKRFTSHPDAVDEHFCFSSLDWRNYGLWTKNGAHQFRRYRDELIEHGFIICVADNSHAKRLNIYGFSDKWRLWNKPNFTIGKNEKTASLKHADENALKRKNDS